MVRATNPAAMANASQRTESRRWVNNLNVVMYRPPVVYQCGGSIKSRFAPGAKGPVAPTKQPRRRRRGWTRWKRRATIEPDGGAEFPINRGLGVATTGAVLLAHGVYVPDDTASINRVSSRSTPVFPVTRMFNEKHYECRLHRGRTTTN